MAKGRVTNRREVWSLVDRPSARYLRLGLHVKPGLDAIWGLAATVLVPPGEKNEGRMREKRTGKEQKRGKVERSRCRTFSPILLRLKPQLGTRHNIIGYQQSVPASGCSSAVKTETPVAMIGSAGIGGSHFLRAGRTLNNIMWSTSSSRRSPEVTRIYFSLPTRIGTPPSSLP